MDKLQKIITITITIWKHTIIKNVQIIVCLCLGSWANNSFYSENQMMPTYNLYDWNAILFKIEASSSIYSVWPQSSQITDSYFLLAELLILSSSSGTFQKLGLFYNSCLKMRDKRMSTAPSELPFCLFMSLCRNCMILLGKIVVFQNVVWKHISSMCPCWHTIRLSVIKKFWWNLIMIFSIEFYALNYTFELCLQIISVAFTRKSK